MGLLYCAMVTGGKRRAGRFTDDQLELEYEVFHRLRPGRMKLPHQTFTGAATTFCSLDELPFALGYTDNAPGTAPEEVVGGYVAAMQLLWVVRQSLSK